MSDPQYGEPVEPNPSDEQTPVSDVVGRVNESLAEAEAASRDAVGESELADAAPTDATDAASDAAPTHDFSEHENEPVDPDLAYLAAPAPVAAPVAAPPAATEPEVAPAAATEAYTPPAAADAVTASEPAAAPQPIFVQAPEAPRPRGNRGAAGLIGLVAAVVFGALYLAAALGFRLLGGEIVASDLVTQATAALTSFCFWVPVVVFFLAFWLLGAIINRGRWGQWVIFGLLVGAAAYGGHLLGQLFQAPFWTLTASQGAELVQGQLLAPAAIVAGVLGREITIWFGAWVAARGARVTELNTEAQREYERTLEAGPQLRR